MEHLRTAIFALALGLLAAPALAGGVSFDLPRLDFPAPAPETTRDCAAQGGKAVCAPNDR
ncbi:hypothetical protein DEA8626_00200 [Defluviimonas aquaemixtae]|uniref:Uncharacterized protein n=1 Tax=Albidovulum aquaemixtae TaxID=1542388 RepID=A0A2R8B231_9RHOB|nr:hypothetical protein [Defluviimonas aquaemixtae]SPH16689.1 hypothetical protein DEA8626_00200 [Defluviimonas aquaemixtae]